ncbi:cytochrome-c peroxidase [Candidatus Uabimicrobium sp. HlEnr_7]|uniref:cytochrome-c peroxidase n=1 Tax=Candidatus Uabimicrobium helgolandensis TaxID=3095367 RepID=UPI0035583E67
MEKLVFIMVVILFLLGCDSESSTNNSTQNNTIDTKTKLQVLSVNEIAALMYQAQTIFGAIPEKMPGGEKDTPNMRKLGKHLFFEKRLSKNNKQSCNSCHNLNKNGPGVDNRSVSPGAFGDKGGRNSPTVLNAGFHIAQFWDGRAKDLVEQAKGPVLNPIEMAMPNEKYVEKKLRSIKKYRILFRRAFPRDKQPVSYGNMASAIAAFERTLITRDRFDDFLKGDPLALNNKELKGLKLVIEKGCISCHNGPLLGANSFQIAGLVNRYPGKIDMGRFEITKNELDKEKFKVPSWRNIAITAPYFHDGGTNTLKKAVQQMAWMQLGKKLDSEEVDLIVVFLSTLTDKKKVTKP